MVSLDSIKIPLFADIADELLEKLAKLATLERYADGNVIYKRGENASMFYILKSGEVILEQELGDDVIATTNQLKAGTSFGLSSLTHDSKYKTTAVAKGACELLFISSEEMLSLMQEDTALGYSLLKPLYDLLLSSLDLRTAQFLQMLTQHPELKAAL